MPHGVVVPGNDLIVLANEEWTDESVEPASHPDDTLEPGESVTTVSIVANDPEVMVYLSQIGTTHHTADIDGDGTDESVVEYRIEQKQQRNDRWAPLRNAVQTAPYGTFNKPVELIPGKLVGPFDAVRVRFTNRSDGAANPTNIDIESVGTYVTAAVSRDGPHQQGGR